MSSSQTSLLVPSDVGQWVKLIATSFNINHLRDPKGLKCCVLLTRRRYDLLPDALVGSGMWEHKERKIKKDDGMDIGEQHKSAEHLSRGPHQGKLGSFFTSCSFQLLLKSLLLFVFKFRMSMFLRPWLPLMLELITFVSMSVLMFCFSCFILKDPALCVFVIFTHHAHVLSPAFSD